MMRFPFLICLTFFGATANAQDWAVLRDAVPIDPVEGLVEAFASHRIVAIDEGVGHGHEQGHSSSDGERLVARGISRADGGVAVRGDSWRRVSGWLHAAEGVCVHNRRPIRSCAMRRRLAVFEVSHQPSSPRRESQRTFTGRRTYDEY